MKISRILAILTVIALAIAVFGFSGKGLKKVPVSTGCHAGPVTLGGPAVKSDDPPCAQEFLCLEAEFVHYVAGERQRMRGDGGCCYYDGADVYRCPYENNKLQCLPSHFNHSDANPCTKSDPPCGP